MSLSETLHEELDRSFGTGPAHRPVEETLQSGRRALLRRRVGLAAGALAVLASIGTVYAEVRPRVVVHEHIENPYDYQPPSRSDALDITFRVSGPGRSSS